MSDRCCRVCMCMCVFYKGDCLLLVKTIEEDKDFRTSNSNLDFIKHLTGSDCLA